jgi:hypothetical protein
VERAAGELTDGDCGTVRLARGPRPAEESRTEDQALANEIGCGSRVGVRIGGEETDAAAFEVDVRGVTALPRVGLADVEPELAPRFDGGSERRHCG